MAARVLFQRAAPAAAPTAAVLLMVAYPTQAHAEAPDTSPHHHRKPIYDDPPGSYFNSTPSTPSSTAPTTPVPTEPPTPSATTTTASSSLSSSISSLTSSLTFSKPEPTPEPTGPRRPTPTDRLATQIGYARVWLHSRAVTAENAVDGTLTRAFALERSFTDTVASLAPPRDSGERLMPGTIYVLVAAMAGTVVTRNRGIFLRGAAPMALGFVAAKTFLPVTMRNVGDLVWEWEKKVPAVAEVHTKVTDGWATGVQHSRLHIDIGKTWVEEKVAGARDSVEGWVKKGE